VGLTTCKYWIGKKRVTAEEYKDYLENPFPASKCKPCYLINQVKGITVYEGEFYQDCGIGVYIRRYPNGKIKEKGQYFVPQDKNYEGLGKAHKCSIKTGEWFYYKENGELEKTVIYDNDIELKK